MMCNIYKMERLPFDIIINHIIPYTYNIQPKVLLEDIKNYYEIKTQLLGRENRDTNFIKRELLKILYLDKKLNNILCRRFQRNVKKYNYTTLSRYSYDTKFNILFGLFTPKERCQFSEHILKNILM